MDDWPWGMSVESDGSELRVGSDGHLCRPFRSPVGGTPAYILPGVRRCIVRRLNRSQKFCLLLKKCEKVPRQDLNFQELSSL